MGPPRRRCLPAASGPGTDVSLWNILRNNIGKDLSKVSMPVQLNEPLNTLQRLCEELEYSSLLDRASRTADPCERMVRRPRRLPPPTTRLPAPSSPGWGGRGVASPLIPWCSAPFRCTLQPSRCLPTPPRTTGRAASPSTLSWGRPMSVSALTEASASSVSRCRREEAGWRGGRVDEAREDPGFKGPGQG